MIAETRFISTASLICEPTRARMLWHLRDGKAFTAIELAEVAKVSPTSASNHLSKLLKAGLIKMDNEGRHRYFVIANSNIAKTVKSIANIEDEKPRKATGGQQEIKGVRYCRTCYDHLAGYVGVKVAEAMERQGYLKRSENIFLVTEKGWKWFGQFDISKEDFENIRRPLTRQCLDWSERKPHLAGQLGTLFLKRMLQRKWFQKVPGSRELKFTSKGRNELNTLLQMDL